jgi:hypothetical protein
MVVSNFMLHNDLQIPFITEEIKRYSTIYYNRLVGHENSYVTELSNPLDVRRRLKRQWPSDLNDQREEEEIKVRGDFPSTQRYYHRPNNFSYENCHLIYTTVTILTATNYQ